MLMSEANTIVGPAAEIQYYIFMLVQMKRALNRCISFFVSKLIDMSIMDLWDITHPCRHTDGWTFQSSKAKCV